MSDCYKSNICINFQLPYKNHVFVNLLFYIDFFMNNNLESCIIVINKLKNSGDEI